MCVDHRASGVHTDYELHARQLDAAHHSHIADPAARPIFLRLTQEFPRVRGQVFGAFREAVGKKLDGKPWNELSAEQKERRIKKSVTDQMHGFTEFVDLLEKEKRDIAAVALRRCARAASRDRHGRGGEGVARERGLIT